MSPMLLNGMSDGPAMVLSPPQDHAFVQFPSAQRKLDPASNNLRTYAANSGLVFANGANVNVNGSSFNAVPAAKPSRKRSRDDAGFEEAMSAPVEPPAPAPAPEPEEPIYGEGMVLLNPRTGLGVSAESQTGTWYEENAEQSVVTAPPVAKSTGASDVQGRKSQRLDPSAPGLDDISLSSVHKRLQSTTNDDNRDLNTGNRSNPLDEPLVDDATRLLGISWQRINNDPNDDMAPAVRGWKKYVDIQYSAHLQDCQMLMKSRSLNAFLVAARPTTFVTPANSPAYYLFSEDLDQARLVGSTWETCVQNLQSSPVLFEGTEVLSAVDKRSNGPVQSVPLSTEAGVPLLQSLSAQPQPQLQPVSNGGIGELNGGVGTGMEIDS